MRAERELVLINFERGGNRKSERVKERSPLPNLFQGWGFWDKCFIVFRIEAKLSQDMPDISSVGRMCMFLGELRQKKNDDHF